MVVVALIPGLNHVAVRIGSGRRQSETMARAGQQGRCVRQAIAWEQRVTQLKENSTFRMCAWLA